MSRRPESAGPALTPEQRALFESEPELAEAAAAAAYEAMGEAPLAHLSWQDMVVIAAVGAMEATITFDPARGSTYRQWGFFAGVHAVLQSAREEHQQYAKEIALIRASVLTYFGHAQAGVEVGADTEETIAAKLRRFSDPVLGLALMQVATQDPANGGEDEVVAREAAARAGDALREVLAEIAPDERRMIELHFTQRLPLTQVAAALGVDAPGYRTFVRRFHEVQESLRARLAQRGITELPPWREDLSGHALGEPGDPP